jgi:endonuclease-3
MIQSGVASKTIGVVQETVEHLREKASAVEASLTQYYGPRDYNPDAYDKDLLGALIATVLSQHTSDLNSGRAYLSLKRAFPGGWNDILRADVETIADSIRLGGLANVKAPRIQRLVQDVVDKAGSANLDILYDLNDDHRRLEFLKSFHGIGPKTAACVLCFNMGRPVIPVDTHVHRVARRIGLIGERTSADKAHDELLEIAPPNKAYSFHVHLIEHGRRICQARRPKCAQCPVLSLCERNGV